jgi:hypothetical protein
MAISQLYPNQRPILNLNFARSKALDPRITFTRDSIATYVGSDGLIKTAAAGEARFDHNGNGDSLGLLIEESRTNSITNSAVFSSGYGVSNVAATDNAAGAPDGTTTAASLMETGGAGFHNFYRPEITSGAAGDYAQSIFVKDNGRAYVNLRWLSNSVSNCWHTVTFALIGDGAVTQEQSGSGANFTNISRSIEHIGNGWYRITLGASNPNAQIYPWILDGSDSPTPTLNSLYGVASYTGDTQKGYYIWGAQVETGTFATSYIPTSGSTVDRDADTCEMTGDNFSSWYTQNEWTVINSFNLIGSNGASPNAASFFPSGGNDAVLTTVVLVSDVGTADHKWLGGPNGTAILNYPSPPPPPTLRTDSKAAVSFVQQSTAEGACNGVLASNLTATPSTNQNMAQLGFGQRYRGVTNTTGHIKRFSYYPYRLTASQLQELTR